MKVFHCDHCGQLVCFENSECLNCGHTLAYLPELSDLCSLEQTPEGHWITVAPEAGSRHWKLCANYSEQNVCNWALPADDPHALCASCRLTRVIPNLTAPENHAAWFKLETAKRRLVYSLLEMQLPLISKVDDPEHGVEFHFLADDQQRGTTVLSGHDNGTITINIAEADDAERERRRTLLHEPYRTLIGHFRHEIGHYYWERLIKDQPVLSAFRELFGDETQDYGAALKQHYEKGPAENWQQQYISAYASAHPWEDWAETWAHYLHMTDALQMAAHSGLSLRPTDKSAPMISRKALKSVEERGFDRMIEAWFPLTYLINNLNRGLGLPDGYPFVLSFQVIAKLHFVHDLITNSLNSQSATNSAPQGDVPGEDGEAGVPAEATTAAAAH